MQLRPRFWGFVQLCRLSPPRLALALAGLVVSLPALAAEKVYTIANYPIEATAENAVKAKEKALADGQQAAFRSLLEAPDPRDPLSPRQEPGLRQGRGI